jgi:cyclopropane-fatty-acyl-phospholipid synthase
MFLLEKILSRGSFVGQLTVIDADGKHHVFGAPGGREVTIRLIDRALHTKLFLHPELVAGESYMDGTLVIEQGTLRDFLTIFFENKRSIRSHPLQKTINAALKKFKKLHQRNDAKQARANVHHHYDLSNDLYRMFLDEDMHYSCAYFEDDEDLEMAQQRKLRHIAAKLDLRPGQRILDIGCGWGGMALYLARAADVEVLGVTLSTEQLNLARARARERGLDNRVRFELMDYRHVQGEFDRIVSIGMFEHVGIANYDAFFRQVKSLLKPDGVALLHSIGRKTKPNSTSPWIRKYIFPGGYIPSMSEVLPSVERAGLWMTDLEILRLHYAKTLRHWHERFQTNRARIAKLLDERFCRMWEFYLVGSELSFTHGGHMIFQMQLTRALDVLPLTRDYMRDKELRLPLPGFTS